MSTTTSAQPRKSSARKLAAASAQKPEAPMQPPAVKPAAKAQAPKPAVRTESPLIDVPPSDKNRIGVIKATHTPLIEKYVNDNFEAIDKKDMAGIISEVAECFVQKRSPKQGGIWGESTEVIEEMVKLVEAAEEQAPSEKDSGLEPEVNPDHIHGDAPPEEPQDEVASETPTMFKKPKKADKKKHVQGEPRRGQPLRSVKKAEAPAINKTKTNKATPLDLAALKKLKGREQWFAANEMLRSSKDIRIQAQDVEEVIGHLYEVSIGKAKLKEDGFEGKGEKSYRKARILGFKRKIEALIQKAK